VKIDDIYHDVVLKRKLAQGTADTTKPEKTCKIKFDISIKIDGSEIYTSTPP